MSAPSCHTPASSSARSAADETLFPRQVGRSFVRMARRRWKLGAPASSPASEPSLRPGPKPARTLALPAGAPGGLPPGLGLYAFRSRHADVVRTPAMPPPLVLVRRSGGDER